MANLNAHTSANRHDIHHINTPQELLSLSAAHNLCLEKFLDDIICGDYALYRIDHQEQFAVAEIRRTDDDGWQIADIRGERNAEPSEEMRMHVHQWLARETSHELSKRNRQAP